MGKLVKLMLIASVFFMANIAQAYTVNYSIPVMNTTITQTPTGATINYSRPISYAGSKMVKRPPYYKECKRKLGFWDEDICAQYYVPKVLEKLSEDD